MKRVGTRAKHVGKGDIFRLSGNLSHVIHRNFHVRHRLNTILSALESRLTWLYEHHKQDMRNIDKRLKELEQNKQDMSDINRQLEERDRNFPLNHVEKLNYPDS
jgi:phosphoglycerate-specific signal transduction histidine kinase